MKKADSSRRDFLVKTGGLAGASWLALNTPILMAAANAAGEQQAAGEAWVNLTSQEVRTYAAVVDQIIPPDDLPGAAEIGAVYFIDQALGGFMAANAGMLKQGLADLDSRSHESFPGSDGFADLSFEQQTEILQSVETTPFFNVSIFLTHCGMFAMPSWGGNKDRAGWALLGFDNRHGWQPPFGYYDAQLAARESGHGE